MKATKTNKQNRAKRTLATLLAAIAMMTATVPTAASAAMLTSDTPAVTVDINAEPTEADFEEMLSKMSLEQILNIWAKIDTSAAAAQKGTDTESKKTDSGSDTDPLVDEVKALAIKYGKKLFKFGVEKLVDTAPAPMNSLLKAPVGSLVDMALGDNKAETSNDDVIAAIEKQTAAIQAQLAELEQSIIQSSKDISSSTSYGDAMDDFTAAAKASRKQIKNFLDDEDLTDNERAVKIAELYDKKDLESLMDRVTLVLNDSPNADEGNRNMFEVAYDIYKKQSLFSGEAIDKSQAYVLKRVNDYMQDCLVVLEVMKARERVTEFTSEEVAALDFKARNIYDSFTFSQRDAKNAIASLISQLIKSDEANKEAKKDHEEGILNMAKEYFSQDRFVYINRGKEYVPVNQRLCAAQCYYYLDFKTESHLFYDETLAELNAGRLNQGKVLTQTDIRYIAEQAKSEKKTITKYLEDIGFDTGSDRYTGNAPLLLDGDYYDTFSEFAIYSTHYARVYGYRMENTSDYARTDRNLVKLEKSCWSDDCYWDTVKKGEPVTEKLGLYLVKFVSRDFEIPEFVG